MTLLFGKDAKPDYLEVQDRRPLTKGISKGAAKAFIDRALRHQTDECLLWPYAKMSSGYGAININGRKEGAHRVVCVRFWGPPTDRQDAAHECGNRLCVNPAHLRWANRSDNLSDRDRHGTHQKGENAPWAKLNAADIREIRGLRGVETQDAIGQRFGIPQSYVSEIQLGKVWEIVV